MRANAMNGLDKALAATFGEEKLRRLQQVRIGVAGAGGLGSNAALFLARSGFKRFKIVDFDRVDYSNLNRQFFFYRQVGEEKVKALKENLLSVSPDLEIEISVERIDGESAGRIFTGCQAVVEALDGVEYKKLLIEAYMNTDILLVAASGLGGWGETDNIRVRRVKDNFFLVGDLVSGAGPDCPALAPGVAVTAAKQADVVLSYFLGKTEGRGCRGVKEGPGRIFGGGHLRDNRLGTLSGQEQHRGGQGHD